MSDEYVPLIEEIDFPLEPNDGDLNISGKGSFGSLNVSGIGTITDLNSTQFFCSGVSTFVNGPIFLGAATSTGTTSQSLQITGGVYISGNLGIGTTNPSSKIAVDGDVSVSGVITATQFYGSFIGYASTAGIATYATTSGISTTSQGLTGSPNIIVGITTVGIGTTSAPSNSQLTFELISDTNLRIKVRGTDGVLRSANITLA